MLDLVGVWRLVDLYALAGGTGERTELLGVDPRGCAVFEPGGRMMAIVTASDRMTGRSVPEMAELFLFPCPTARRRIRRRCRSVFRQPARAARLAGITPCDAGDLRCA
jgi:Lipocalin-like domain